MKKTSIANNLDDLPLEALLLQFSEDKYKVAYAAIRWAKEIKQKESLADPIPTLVPRALREILSGKVTFKDIEHLPVIAKVAPPPQAQAAAPAPHPTITLSAPDSKDDADEDESEEASEEEEKA